jgi:hypothetical protein
VGQVGQSPVDTHPVKGRRQPTKKADQATPHGTGPDGLPGARLAGCQTRGEPPGCPLPCRPRTPGSGPPASGQPRMDTTAAAPRPGSGNAGPGSVPGTERCQARSGARHGGRCQALSGARHGGRCQALSGARHGGAVPGTERCETRGGARHGGGMRGPGSVRGRGRCEAGVGDSHGRWRKAWGWCEAGVGARPGPVLCPASRQARCRRRARGSVQGTRAVLATGRAPGRGSVPGTTTARGTGTAPGRGSVPGTTAVRGTGSAPGRGVGARHEGRCPVRGRCQARR